MVLPTRRRPQTTRSCASCLEKLFSRNSISRTRLANLRCTLIIIIHMHLKCQKKVMSGVHMPLMGEIHNGNTGKGLLKSDKRKRYEIGNS